MIALLASVWLGCGGPDVDCASPSDVIAESDGEALSCRRADWLVDYWELLRASTLPNSDRRLVRRALAARFDDDPKGTVALLGDVRERGRHLAGLRGDAATRARSTQVFEAHSGAGPFTDGELDRLQRKLIPIWGSSETAHVALTESDVEAWIRYASLCREVQGGTPLRISVADRLGVYRTVQQRFEGGSTDEQVAMGALGSSWLQIQRAWILASYEEQQAWIADAPLPGPMTGSSVDYLRAIVTGDVAGHVRELERHFGPFTVQLDRPMFLDEDPTTR